MAADGHSTVAERPSYLGHHYDTVEQQFSSGKLGMWLFLATEVLLFAGLFCAYAIYRRYNPEVFEYAHHFLDTKLGAINTIVLIFSSFTMAMAVRASQTGKTRMLIALLSVTFACGGVFMGIKYVEYSHKFHQGLLWGTEYEKQEGRAGHGHGEEAAHADEEAAHAGEEAAHAGEEAAHAGEEAAHAGEEAAHASDEAAHASDEAAHASETHETPAASFPAEAAAVEVDPLRALAGYEPSQVPRAAVGPEGIATAPAAPIAAEAPEPQNVQYFFGIYFLLTGLHGLHVLIGMIVIGWLIVRAALGHFSPAYFTPVDLGGLYWHLVDLIWIYLFPLLYLIS